VVRPPSATDPPESEDYEEKAGYANSDQDRVHLIKTIVAMANTAGGRIMLKGVHCDRTLLDSSRIDDMVNRYVERPVHGISSHAITEDAYEVTVQSSGQKPHLFRSHLDYKDDKGRPHTAFHPGQIWCRQSSKTKEAGIADLDRMCREYASRLLKTLGQRVLRPSFALDDSEATPTPVRLSDDPNAVPIAAPLDIATAYPYTATTLGRKLGKNGQWLARAASTLSLKGNPTYSFGMPTSGRQMMWRYSEAADDRIRRVLESDPNWTPYR